MKKTNVSSEVLILAKTKSVLSAFWTHFGVHFGVHFGHFFSDFGGPFLELFLELFWNHFGVILEPILEPARPKRQARRAQERHQELERGNKLHFQKPQKTFSFWRFLRSRGCTRGHHEPQESSQEPPKELQSIIKKESINGSQTWQLFDQFWDHFGAHFGAENSSKNWSKKEPILDQKK